jgi:hypothetical protein
MLYCQGLFPDVKAPDSAALSQSCTATERAIVEGSVSFERQGDMALSRNLLIVGEREPVGNNQHQDPLNEDPEMMWRGPDTIEEIPIRPMAMPIDFDPWRCQNESPIPAVHTAELGQPPFKHTTTIFCDNQLVIAPTKDGTHHVRMNLTDTCYNSNCFSGEDRVISSTYPTVEDFVTNTHHNPPDHYPPRHSESTLFGNQMPASTYRQTNARRLRGSVGDTNDDKDVVGHVT